MRILAFIIVYLALATGAVQSQELANGVSLTVMPLVLDVKPPKVADNIMVRNTSRMPVRLQVRVFRWQQKGGKDYYAPTNDVVITPPFVSVKPGGVATVRVSRVAKGPVLGQEAYRVFVDQIPPSALRTNNAGESSAGVSMVLRQVVPVFFSPGTGGVAASQASISFFAQPASGGFNITATNRGSNRIRMADVFLLAGGQVIGAKSKLVGYALPGSDFRFFVATRGGGKPDRIRFTSDVGQIEYPLQ
ncbi:MULTISPECIES: fimbrial biogenesis chaperone [unclassified Bartonella]|uniref:fimbrial biogenesis chaperone n=1 Tax=unclassified Bartonella TaxID=2645622 RepID=UPI0021C5E954|nr:MULTISPECIES: fimbria/pilus periplasmic chaperone [unclassified Bartonella]UXN04413.1 fimbria/pilus periplasmic chaperone [Bartonella sp. HY406]UXN07407.1 fimbria/pilus periplasmic chaperone [Bartonella sp. HY761]